MRITSIKVCEKANLGNYESLEFTAEAVIDEGDNHQAVTAQLTEYVNWNAHKRTREDKARAYRKIAADESIPAEDPRKHEAEVWLRKYEEAKARVEAM